MQSDNTELLHQMWVFTGGAIIVLLTSIISEVRRNWWSLLAGCVLGGAGAWVAGQIWGDSKYVYLICGASAVATEHFLKGCVAASKQFASDPIDVAKVFLPNIFKGSKPADTDNESK